MATAKKRQEERADQIDGYEEDEEEEDLDNCTAAADDYEDAEDPDSSSGGGSDVVFSDEVTHSYGLPVVAPHQQTPHSSLPVSMTSATAAEMFCRRGADAYGTFAPLVN
jgi:hypothetical protein